MRTLPGFFFIAGCLVSLGLFAQNSSLTGPRTGFVFDRDSQSIRPVIGVPGSAHLGPPVVPHIRFGSVAPEGTAAIILANGRLRLIHPLDSATPAAFPLADRSGIPDQVAWAPDSSAAALYFSGGSRVETVTGLSDHPRLGEPIDLSSLDGEISALAISPSLALFVTVRNGKSDGLYLISPGSHPLQIAPMEAPSALSFDRTGEDLYALDGKTGAVFRVRNASELPTASLLIPPSKNATDFVGLAVSGSNSRLMTVSRSARLVRVYDSNSASLLAELPLDGDPSSIRQLAPGSVFLLNADRRPREPLLVLDSQAGPAAYIVPAGGEDR